MINHLFELVEETRLLDDETLNYALIKLLVRFLVLSSPASCAFKYLGASLTSLPICLP